MTTGVSATGGSLYANSNSVANRFGAAMNTPEMMMAIQMERAGIMDDGIKDQMDDMQKRNDWLKDANSALAALRTARPTSTDGKTAYSEITFTTRDGKTVNALQWGRDNGIAMPGGTLPDNDPLKQHLADATAVKAAVDAQAATMGDALATYPDVKTADGKTISVNDWAKTQDGYKNWDNNSSDNVGFKSEFQALSTQAAADITATQAKITDAETNVTQSQFDAAIANLKSAVDTVNSQSQMDMVRLQSQMDKRNQSYDLLTNTLSKNSKQLDSIIGNLR